MAKEWWRRPIARPLVAGNLPAEAPDRKSRRPRRPLAARRRGRPVSKIYNVLFLCTGNSARSVIAETLLNHWGKGLFRAYSAGSYPAGRVHPLTLDLLARLNFPVAGLRSKSWDEFAAPAAPVLDFVFTVCDQAAGEVCPIWPGQPITAHWGFPDPVSFSGTEAEKRAFFAEISA